MRAINDPQENCNSVKLTIVMLVSAGLAACGGGGTDGASSSNTAANETQETQETQFRQSVPGAAALAVNTLPVNTLNTLPPNTSASGALQEAGTLPAGYVRCAGEAQDTNCQFSGNTTMYYGVPGAYAVGTVQGPFNCAAGNSAFGDPIYGTVKSCYVLQSVLTPTTDGPGPNAAPTAGISGLPDGYVRCAAETPDTTCQFTGSTIMYYGVPGYWASGAVQGPFNCAAANSVFGDPLYGTVKSCYVSQAVLRGPVSPPVAPAPTAGISAKIAGIELAQSLVIPSGDNTLPLVANKAVLVKVNVVTDNPQEAKPSASLLVQNAGGQVLQQIQLNMPAGSLPSSVSGVPNFSDSYTAWVPAYFVSAGMRLTASLAGSQTTTTVAPRVAAGLNMKLVAVPVQIGGTVGVVPDKPDSYALARMPVATVTLQTHAPYVSRSIAALPGDENSWKNAFYNVLAEIDSLHYLEQASGQAFYFGFLPKRSYGLAGLGYQPGNAAVGFDMPSNPEVVRQVMTHEIGHNFSLQHAPCGNPLDADRQFPYVDAQLGGNGRYVWGYNFETNTFTDPTRSDAHDIMSYCAGDTFSDYNYRLMQNYLLVANGFAKTAANAGANLTVGPQELLLVSGKVEAGKAELAPTKSLWGQAQLPQNDGPYTLRIVSAQGTLDYRFGAKKLDHADTVQHFSFTIPHPGLIASMTITKDGGALLQNQTKPSAGAARALSAASENQ
jgi:hypothetical protein